MIEIVKIKIKILSAVNYFIFRNFFRMYIHVFIDMTEALLLYFYEAH